MTSIRLGVIALLVSVVAACATQQPVPNEALARAEQSVEQADQAGARRFDPGNLDAAKEKLAQARAAAQKGDKRNATLLAEQAELDAELAAAHGRSGSAKIAADELRASLETLRAETTRSGTR
jgi:Domain of unknown function (DUF4398)